MTIYKFAKCTKTEQEELIQSKGLFLDSWNENENCITLYYLNGFFVEVTLSLFHNDPIEITPFKRWYNIHNYRHQFSAGYQLALEAAKAAA
ncbi:MAG: hypothetical protein ACXVPD_10525 [Bacteroidia bacterium]